MEDGLDPGALHDALSKLAPLDSQPGTGAGAGAGGGGGRARSKRSSFGGGRGAAKRGSKRVSFSVSSGHDGLKQGP